MLLSRHDKNQKFFTSCPATNIMTVAKSPGTPDTLASNVLEKILDTITSTNQITGSDLDSSNKPIRERTETDSGKDSSSISDSLKTDDDSIKDQSEFEDDVNDQDDVGNVCFMENWKMERQFDKAIEGLRKLKDGPVSLTSKGQRKQKHSAPEESHSDDSETFVISPFSENQTYTIKAECESSISPSTLTESPDQSDEGIDLRTENERRIVVKVVMQWRNYVEMMKIRMVKARLFHHLNLKVSALQQWKEFVRRLKKEKEILEKERLIEQDTIKRYLALKYRERNLLGKMFSAWSMYSRIQVRKRKFEALNVKKEVTKKKVDDFLDSLGNISKTNNDWIMQKVKKEKKTASVKYSISFRKFYNTKPKEDEVNTKDEKSPEPQLPSIVKEEKRVKRKPKEDTTHSLQKEIINAQREKMREQWKMIESLKEQKNRLQHNRPATNNKIVKKIEKRLHLEDEINESFSYTEDSECSKDTLPLIESDKKMEDSTGSDNYSDDFEDCVSETQSSICPKTPEMLRKVREREERRTARREEIRKMHQERVEQERERLKALKEKEIQDEIDDRKKTRELWKKKRKEEMEKDRRRLAEKDRQEHLMKIAEEFHLKLSLKQYGLRPWLKLVAESGRKMLQAEQFSKLSIQRQKRTVKEQVAEKFYRENLLRKCWRAWYKITEKEKPKRQAAADFYEIKVCSEMFRRWLEFVKDEKRRRYGIMMKAVVFNRRITLRKYFFMWMKYILLKDSIEKTAKNIEFLRSKVTLLLPDYIPGREN